MSNLIGFRLFQISFRVEAFPCTNKCVSNFSTFLPLLILPNFLHFFYLFEIKSIFIFLRFNLMLQLSEFEWTLRCSVEVVFNNFLLIDATNRIKISSDQKRLFFYVSQYPLSFFANNPFKVVYLLFLVGKRVPQIVQENIPLSLLRPSVWDRTCLNNKYSSFLT